MWHLSCTFKARFSFHCGKIEFSYHLETLNIFISVYPFYVCTEYVHLCVLWGQRKLLFTINIRCCKRPTLLNGYSSKASFALNLKFKFTYKTTHLFHILIYRITHQNIWLNKVYHAVIINTENIIALFLVYKFEIWT